MLDKIRVLPVLIFVCSFMLFVRIDHIWAESKDLAAKTEPKDAAKDEKTETKTDPKSNNKSTEEKKSAEPSAVDAKPSETNKDGAKPESSPSAGAAVKPEIKTADPLLFNDSELDILQSLSARRAQLDERESQIEQKEGLLQITEQRIEQKLEEFRKLKAEIEQTKQKIEKMTSGFDEKEKQRLSGLVKTYETMKPKEAARIFDLMDLPVLMGVIGQMKEAKMAPILASMDPAKAKAVTVELARKNSLPDIGQPIENADKGVPPPPAADKPK